MHIVELMKSDDLQLLREVKTVLKGYNKIMATESGNPLTGKPKIGNEV